MMKTINRCAIFAVLLMFGAPSYADKVTQIWKCEMDEETTEAVVDDMAEAWLEAAKQMKGGENLEMHLRFPVAVNDTGDIDFHIVVTAPSFEEWGRFWDNFEDDSPASLVDEKTRDLFDCPNSALWETVTVQ